MIKLMKLQLRNIFQSKLFYICLILMILLGPVATLAFSNSFSNLIPHTTVCDEIITILSVGIVETIFIALVACSDFNDGTTKNIIARGYTRNQLLFSKYLAILLCLIMMYIITIVFAFILLYKNGIGYNNTICYRIINNIAGILAYSVFYTTMAFLLEKNGAAILACLFVPQLLPTAFMLLNKITHVDMNKLWIDHNSNVFIDKPTLGNLGWSVLAYVIYIIIFIVIGTQLLKRKEIK